MDIDTAVNSQSSKDYSGSVSIPRMLGISQIWLKYASKQNTINPVTINSCQTTAANLYNIRTSDSEYVNNYRTVCTSTYNSCLQYTSAKNTNVVRQLFLRCLPTAACLSVSRNQDIDDVMVESRNFKDTEDSLPGVRVQRKSSLEHRVRTSITEQDISQWLEKETGLDRVKMMYSMGPDGKFILEETRSLNSMLYTSVLLGAVFSVIAAAATVYSTKNDKQISSKQILLQGVSQERNAVKDIVTQSLKDTVRFTACTASLLHLSQTLAAYRNKSSIWEYVISSSLGFGLLGLGKGVNACAKLSLRGAVLGAVGGYVVCQFLTMSGLNQEQRHLDAVLCYIREQNLQKLKVHNLQHENS